MLEKAQKSLRRLLNDTGISPYQFFETVINIEDVAYFSGSDDDAINYNHLKEFYQEKFKYIHDYNREMLHDYFNPKDKSYFYIKLFDDKSLPTTFQIPKNWISTRTFSEIDKNRIKYVYCDLNYIEYIGADVEWPKVNSVRIQSRRLENFEKHFWNIVTYYLDKETCDNEGQCHNLSQITINVLTIDNRIISFDLLEGLYENSKNNQFNYNLRTIELITHFQNNSQANRQKSNVSVGLHIHQTSGHMEIGTIDALSPLAFDELAEKFMNLFSDIFCFTTSHCVSNFTVIDCYKDNLLCKCNDSAKLFSLEFPDFIFYRYEDYINENRPEYEGEIDGTNIDYKILIGMSFSLDSDFIYTEEIENIGKSISVLKDIIRKNA